VAWQKAIDLAELIYVHFRELKDIGFKDLIRRVVVSIFSDIAESFDQGTDTDFKRFLNIAKSSCKEVQSMLYLAERLNYIGSGNTI
jgi:four helix bundle protein